MIAPIKYIEAILDKRSYYRDFVAFRWQPVDSQTPDVWIEVTWHMCPNTQCARVADLDSAGHCAYCGRTWTTPAAGHGQHPQETS